jgi:hypothetical protein
MNRYLILHFLILADLFKRLGYAIVPCSVFVLMILINSPGQAQVVTQLYQAVVPAQQNEEAINHEPLKQALMQVLIKLSGNHKIIADPAVKAKIEQADRFVLQYEYQVINEQSVLSVQFDEVAIKKLLRTVDSPIWSSSRPDWLLWIVLETMPGQSAVLNEEEHANETKAIKTQAVQRGLPVIFPVLDFEDRANLKTSDITTGIKDPVIATAKRYGVKAICTGWLFTSAESGQLEAHWRLYIEDAKELSWKQSGTDLAKILSEATDKTVDSIAHYFLTASDRKSTPETAVSPETPQTKPTDEANTPFKLIVTGIPGMRDYAQVQSYLQNLDVITEVQVLYMRSGQTTFSISSEGGKTAVEQAISLGNVLVPENNPTGGEMTYRFVP